MKLSITLVEVFRLYFGCWNSRIIDFFLLCIFCWLLFLNRLIPSLNRLKHISSPHMCIHVLFFGLDSKHQKIKINILKFSAKTFTHVYTHFNFCAHKFSMHFIFIRRKVMTLFSPSQTELKWEISSLSNPVDYI